MHDSVRVTECLRKALRIASQVMDDLVQISLFNHILNENLYFYERGCTDVSIFFLLQAVHISFLD